MTDRVYLKSIEDLKPEMRCPNCEEPISEYSEPAFYCSKCSQEISFYIK